MLAVSNLSSPDPNLAIASGLIAISLALIHLMTGKVRSLQAIPRSRWLSFSSGVAVAYVFIHILPELSQAQETFTQESSPSLAFIEHHIYLIALLGVAFFYGLERAVKLSRRRNRNKGGGDRTEAGIFWLHILSFMAYNALIGYLLLHREEPGWLSLVLFAIAMAFHFIVNDYGLRQDHKEPYDHMGRWLLAAAIVMGWVIGTTSTISEVAIAIFFAFLAGGVTLNVFKEELPEERESRFSAFLLGTASYAILLLAI